MAGVLSTVETVVVDVKQEHIDRGRRRDPYACPIALAARAAGLASASMHIDGMLCLPALEGYAPRYFNTEAGQFGQAFDHCQPVGPRSFTFHRIMDR